MKQLSARVFRLTFPKITEPVLVLTRKGGEYRELGTWTPASNGAAPVRYEQGDLGTALARFGVPSAAPKPSRKRP